MRRSLRTAGTVLLCLAALGLIGCAKKKVEEAPPAATPPAALHVTSLELGKQLDADRRIVSPMTTFNPRDTIFVSVATDGSSPAATLAARWTFGPDGQIVNEMSQPIAPTGAAVTEFHIVRPTAWPEGAYKVEIMLDGAPAGTKEFTVAR